MPLNHIIFLTAISLGIVAIASAQQPRTVTEFAKITAPVGAEDAGFGARLAVSGDDVVVGAPSYITKDGVVGAAFVFHRLGPRWLEIAKLLPADTGIDGEDFGLSVAVEGDYIVVGAPHIVAGVIGSGVGRVFIYRRYDRGTPDDPFDDLWSPDAMLTSPDEINGGDHYGMSVSISGETVLVGRPGWEHSSGAAYLYRPVNSVWIHTGSLYASDSTLDDAFGQAVSLSGTVALVGAPRRRDTEILSRGVAYVFRELGAVWTEENKLTPRDGDTLDHFGSAVSISDQYAFVGALADDDAGPNTGSVYVFTHEQGPWISETKLLAGDASDLSHFGQAVATDGSKTVIGAPAEHSHFGAAYLFRREEDQWIEERKFVASDRTADAVLGVSVAAGGNYAFAGAAGGIYVYVVPSAAKTLHGFATFQTCFRQAEGGWMTKCADVDLVGDGRIDLQDYYEFLATFSGP